MIKNNKTILNSLNYFTTKYSYLFILKVKLCLKFIISPNKVVQPDQN